MKMCFVPFGFVVTSIQYPNIFDSFFVALIGIFHCCMFHSAPWIFIYQFNQNKEKKKKRKSQYGAYQVDEMLVHKIITVYSCSTHNLYD